VAAGVPLRPRAALLAAARMLLAYRATTMASHDDSDDGGAARAAPASELGEVGFRACGGRVPRVLAHGGNGEKHLTHDERYLYWTDGDDGTVTRLPKDGGIPLVLATDLPRPGPITLSDGWLYWINSRYETVDHQHVPRGSVVRMPKGGGDVEVIAREHDSPEAIAVHGDTVAWTTFGDGLATGTVKMRTIPDGRVITLATRQKQPRSIALDAECVYWANYGNKRPHYFTDGSVMRMPRDGGRKRFVIAKNESMPHGMVMDEGHIYWTTSTEFYDRDRWGAVEKRRKGGKSVIVPLVLWPRPEGRLALDATHVYWFSHFGGGLFRVPKEVVDDREPEQLMTHLGGVRLWVETFVVDDRCVYWATRDSRSAGGAIFKMAK
jgi:hypothetical protein